ncbi:MAG: purine-binding chemotaxis protein CheW [Calditrichaceae bacterium]|nr:purine-binding chemotaxis protein CheW [Calditrichaceae bacterium]
MTKDSPTKELTKNNESRYSVINLSGHYFGIEINKVVEIIPLPRYTKIPNLDACILGVFNLRGQIYSILDMRVLFDLESNDISDKNYVVLLKDDNISFGIYVDKVMDVLDIDETKIQVPNRKSSANFIHFLNGLYDDKKLGAIHLLEVREIIGSKEISQYRF